MGYWLSAKIGVRIGCGLSAQICARPGRKLRLNISSELREFLGGSAADGHRAKSCQLAQYFDIGFKAHSRGWRGGIERDLQGAGNAIQADGIASFKAGFQN